MVKTSSANPQQTYLLTDLHIGNIYRDALSGYLVLVMEREVAVYDERRNKSIVKRQVGWMWNPVYGKHQEMELHDHQLISAEADTALLPDTRNKNGYHGK